MIFNPLIKKYEKDCDYLYVSLCESEGEVINLENGATSLRKNTDFTYSIRALYNGCWGLSYSNDLRNADKVFKHALINAKLASKYLNKELKIELPNYKTVKKTSVRIDPLSIDLNSKVNSLIDFERAAKQDERIKNVISIIVSSKIKNRIIADDCDITQDFIKVGFRSMITAVEGGLMQNTTKTFSKLGGYEIINKLDFNDIALEMAAKVNRLLKAKSPKPGKYPVICDNEMTGLFFHEAVGHACEADSILQKTSVFNDKKGQVVGSPEITLMDDPRANENGFYWFDDEGVKPMGTTLINKGVLNSYLHTLTTAGLMNEKPTGNGRAESPAVLPLPRMSNITLKKGNWSFNELLKKIKKGFYVKGFKGGEVDSVTGDFCFGADECYSIIKGKLKESLRDVTLGGNTLNTLKGLLVGNDPKPTFISSYCGKNNQDVRVGNKCPHILIKEAIIGGRD